MDRAIAQRVWNFFKSFWRQQTHSIQKNTELTPYVSRDDNTHVDIAKRVQQFIADFCLLPPTKIQSTSRLEEDLGITGLDAVELIESFSETFDVDLTSFDFFKHFGPDYLFTPCFKSLKYKMRDYGKYPVTVDHLVEVAQNKHWSCPPSNQ